MLQKVNDGIRNKKEQEERYDDPPGGNGGIPDRPAGEGEQSQDVEVLPADPDEFHEFCRANYGVGDCGSFMQEVLPSFIPEEYYVNNGTDVYTGFEGIPDLVFQ
jgi:hypothetical protein